MSNWDELKNTDSFKTYYYIPYYNSTTTILNGYAGRLRKGTVFKAEYIESKDAMKITSCAKKPEAVGKYILTPIFNGNHAIYPESQKNVTTESKVTIDTTTNTATPENTDTQGNTSGSETSITDTATEVIDEAFNMSDEFLEESYERLYTNEDEYIKNLKDGLTVSSLRAVLGMPHQFLPTADPRLVTEGEGDCGEFGRVYSEKIVKNIPLLLITPGVPEFLASFSEEQKSLVIGKLIGMLEETFDSIFKDSRSGKYYSLKYAYTDYFHYVNAMLRSAAHFLGIQGERLEEDGPILGETNWLYTSSSMGTNIFTSGKLENFLGPYAGCLAFYIDCGTTVDDSFSNSTTESALASGINTLSDKGREMNFLIGNIGGEAGLKLDALTGGGEVDDFVNDVQGAVDEILGKSGSIFHSILGKASTVLAGGRIIFPEIWTDSSFSRSYSCSMKLVSPSGDKLSVYLNILVPIYHLLALTLPRQSTNQAYFSPFLVRAHCAGSFNVDMGIISGLSITKGDEGEWSVYGIPTVANVNFEIKDLYDGMYMSTFKAFGDASIMSNIQELDYIANSCGVNVNDQEIMRTISMWGMLGFSGSVDKVTIDIFGKTAQYLNQKIQNIFGVF